MEEQRLSHLKNGKRCNYWLQNPFSITAEIGSKENAQNVLEKKIIFLSLVFNVFYNLFLGTFKKESSAVAMQRRLSIKGMDHLGTWLEDKPVYSSVLFEKNRAARGEVMFSPLQERNFYNPQ